MLGARKKSGRKPKRQPKPGERVPLSLRVTPDVKKLLDDAAAQSGRSQSQEAEGRLERSFRDERLLTEILELAYGTKLGALVQVLASVMRDAAIISMPKDDSIDDPVAYDQAVKAAAVVFEELRPPGNREPRPIGLPDHLVHLEPQLRNQGEIVARMRLSALRAPDEAPTKHLRDWARPLAEKLKSETSA